MKFTKTYSGIIKRKISEGTITPSSLPEVYLKTSSNEIEISSEIEAYPAKIFNIVRNKNKTEITTNTLGLNITDKVFNNKPYFKIIEDYDLDINLLNSYDTYVDKNITYINTDVTYIQLGQKIFRIKDVVSLNLWDRSEKVTVRRLKDRFKLTIRHEEDFIINLKSTSIFQPSIHNNNLHYYDCVFNNSDFLYTHSFETYKKEEIHFYSDNSYILKDIPVSPVIVSKLNDKYVKIVYNTFRSNLFFSLNLTEPAHILVEYIEGLPELKRISASTNSPTGKTILTYKPSYNVNIDKLQINPYMNIKRFKSRPEGVVFVWKGYEDFKYSRCNDIPFGTERVILDLKKVMAKEIVAFSVGTKKVIQKYTTGIELDASSPKIEYTGNKAVLDDLLTKIRG